ncbi:MAG: M23 family metallopeptidase [Paludibacteraceae bacterium]|nr:M23 family metallopeptidase [Paludibacteraceae bacterium]MBR4815596.1 M23 family metallopeptidase [Paludibacteraceae bacterium]
MDNKLDNFLKRIRFKYKISILNENTLEEVFHIRLSKGTVLGASFLIAIVYFFLIAILIIKTPIRGFLPGYTENINLRRQLMQEALVVDSLAEQLDIQIQYMDGLRAVMTGKVLLDSASTPQVLSNITSDKISLEPSERESAYRDSFEASELEIINSINSTSEEVETTYLMCSPAKGRVIDTFNIRKRVYGTTIVAVQNTSVLSVLDGIVISSDYSFRNLYVLCIQHADNIVTVYKTRQPFIKQKGTKVHAGEILTTFRNGTDSYFEFELWKDGVAVNPLTYISF